MGRRRRKGRTRKWENRGRRKKRNKKAEDEEPAVIIALLISASRSHYCPLPFVLPGSYTPYLPPPSRPYLPFSFPLSLSPSLTYFCCLLYSIVSSPIQSLPH